MLSKVRTDPDRGGTEAIAHPDCHGCQHSLLAGKSSYRAAHLPHTVFHGTFMLLLPRIRCSQSVLQGEMAQMLSAKLHDSMHSITHSRIALVILRP